MDGWLISQRVFAAFRKARSTSMESIFGTDTPTEIDMEFTAFMIPYLFDESETGTFTMVEAYANAALKRGWIDKGELANIVFLAHKSPSVELTYFAMYGEDIPTMMEVMVDTGLDNDPSPRYNKRTPSTEGYPPEWSGPCPSCGEGKDRFILHDDTDTCWCRVCNYWANVDKFARDFNIPIDDMLYIPEIPRHKAYTPPMPTKPNPFTGTPKYPRIDYPFKAVEYFAKWKIDLHTLAQFGVCDAGEPVFAAYIPFYSLWDENVYIGAAYRPFIDQKPKYINEKDMATVGFYNDRILSTPDGSRKGPYIDHCFVVEAQKDVWLLTQMGYNAVAFRGSNDWLYYAKECFKRVGQAIILADNDGGKGWKTAERIQKRLPSASIAMFEEGKQPTDIAKDLGYDAIQDIMKRKFSWLSASDQI